MANCEFPQGKGGVKPNVLGEGEVGRGIAMSKFLWMSFMDDPQQLLNNARVFDI